MALAVCRLAEGHEAEREAALLQGQDLLGDEGFRQPRVALQHHRDVAAAWCAPVARGIRCPALAAAEAGVTAVPCCAAWRRSGVSSRSSASSWRAASRL